MIESTLPHSPAVTVRSNAPRARALRGLRRAIESGTFEGGEPLPSERQLAEQLEVSRNTLRSALAMLEDEGLIASNGGRLRLVTAKTEPVTAGSPEKTTENWLAQAVGVVSYDTAELPAARETGWAMQITRGVFGAIAERQLHGVNLHPASLSPAKLEAVAAEPFQGFVLTEISVRQHQGTRIAEQLRQKGARVAVYGDDASLHSFDRVTSDHQAGAALIVEHLAAQGCRQIAMMWHEPTQDYWFAPRRAGYERAMKAHDLEARPTIPLPGDLLPNYHKDPLNHAQFERAIRVFRRVFGRTSDRPQPARCDSGAL